MKVTNWLTRQRHWHPDDRPSDAGCQAAPRAPPNPAAAPWCPPHPHAPARTPAPARHATLSFVPPGGGPGLIRRVAATARVDAGRFPRAGPVRPPAAGSVRILCADSTPAFSRRLCASRRGTFAPANDLGGRRASAGHRRARAARWAGICQTVPTRAPPSSTKLSSRKVWPKISVDPRSMRRRQEDVRVNLACRSHATLSAYHRCGGHRSTSEAEPDEEPVLRGH